MREDLKKINIDLKREDYNSAYYFDSRTRIECINKRTFNKLISRKAIYEYAEIDDEDNINAKACLELGNNQFAVFKIGTFNKLFFKTVKYVPLKGSSFEYIALKKQRKFVIMLSMLLQYLLSLAIVVAIYFLIFYLKANKIIS